jgi:hypothetical protein
VIRLIVRAFMARSTADPPEDGPHGHLDSHVLKRDDRDEAIVVDVEVPAPTLERLRPYMQELEYG